MATSDISAVEAAIAQPLKEGDYTDYLPKSNSYASIVKVDEVKERFTYADYCTWEEDVRYELIDGIPVVLWAPTLQHQRVLRKFIRIIDTFLDDKPCEMFFAPSDVRLNHLEKDDNVFQPDLYVVCDEKKLEDGKACCGAPDFVIEILSPSTARYDLFLKYQRYLKYGVREYWIIDPDANKIFAFVFEDENFKMMTFEKTETITSRDLKGLSINLAEIFSD